MKKILIVSVLPPPINGQAIATQFLYDALIDKYQVSILNIASKSERTGKSGVFSVGRFLEITKLLFKYFYMLKQNKINIIYFVPSSTLIGHFRDLFFLLIGKFLHRSKLIIQFHSGDINVFNSKKIVNKTSQLIFNNADKIIFSSKTLYNKSELNLNENKIEIIPNTVRLQLEFNRKEIEKKFVEKKKKVTILYLSNLIQSKGYFDVLEATKLLSGYSNSIEFIFAGRFLDNKQEERIKSYLSQHKIRNVKFIGQVNEYKGLLYRSDIFILPTYYPNEAQPVSIIESMNAGLAIISTNHGGIPDLLINHYNGLYVEKKNPNDIASKLKYLLNNDVLLNMKQSSRKIYENEFKRLIIISKYQELFSEL